MLREQYLMRIVAGLTTAIETAKAMGMSGEELMELFRNLLHMDKERVEPESRRARIIICKERLGNEERNGIVRGKKSFETL